MGTSWNWWCYYQLDLLDSPEWWSNCWGWKKVVCQVQTFVFPREEAIITLEELVFLWIIFFFWVDVTTKELLKARLNHSRNRARKSIPSPWMVEFMDCGNKSEHEVFIALCLSRLDKHYTVGNNVLPFVVLLARVTKLHVHFHQKFFLSFIELKCNEREPRFKK